MNLHCGLTYFVLLLIATMNLVSCSSPASSGAANTPCINPNYSVLTVDEDGSKSDYGLSQKYNIVINANGGDWGILQDSPVAGLVIEGSNNLIHIETGVSIDRFCIRGSDNTISIAETSDISADEDSGMGNTFITF